MTALSIATTKTSLGFDRRSRSARSTSALVCPAIWLTYGAHTTADKILAIVPPIAAFVAVGFEHSVANMYFIPAGLLIERDTSWLQVTAGIPDTSGLTWSAFLVDNLIPVTIGN